MIKSTISSKGQTTIPAPVREALNLKPHEELIWDIQADGAVFVRPKPSALSLYGSLQSSVVYEGIEQENQAAQEGMAEEAASEGHS